MLTTEVQYSINFSRSNKKFWSCLHFNGSNSCLFVNSIYDFSVDYKTFDTSDTSTSDH